MKPDGKEQKLGKEQKKSSGGRNEDLDMRKGAEQRNATRWK